MSERWTWRYVDPDGRDVVPALAPAEPFASQSDAESWLGENWRELLSVGVEAVHLREDDADSYGPMSLRPAE
ncbi:MAG: hypothetical protein ACRC35_14690 [Angustibacter sp.]